MYVCMMCVLGTLGGQKRALDSLELKLQMVVIHHMGARNQAQILQEQQVLFTAE